VAISGAGCSDELKKSKEFYQELGFKTRMAKGSLAEGSKFQEKR